MDNIVKARPGLTKITPYVTGESTIKGLKSVVKLSSNESPFGPGPAAALALDGAMSKIGSYPSSDHYELRRAIQESHGFDAKRIICGAGSDEILGLIAQAFTGPGTEVIHTKHGFLMYPIFARSAGAEPVVADEPERTMNVDAILDKCNQRTRLVFIANPSNPTGKLLDKHDIYRLADSLPSDVILVLDGAYAEFVEMDDFNAKLAHERENVMITRTFSKIHGLAALRVGYGYGPQKVIDILNSIRGPFNVNAPAQVAAAAAIKDRDHIQRCQKHNVKWRTWLRNRLINSGIEVDESHCNFVLARFVDSSAAHRCDNWLREAGIIVRRMDNYQLSHCLRITIGSETACRMVADSITGFMQQQQ